MSRGRMPELDGVRGMAIAMVLIWHYVGITLPPAGVEQHPNTWIPNFKQSLIILRSGVDLFFVLSGFLIGGILIDQRQTNNYYKIFFLRRACRILPLYYLLILLFFFARAFDAQGELFGGPIPLLAYATFTQNYFMPVFGTYGAAWLSATWSLAIEEQFYLFFPFVVRRTRRALPWILAAGVIGAPLLRIWSYFYFDGDDFPAYIWLPCRLDSLCWGGLLSYVLRTRRGRSWVDRHRRPLRWSLGTLTIGAVALDVALARDVGFYMSILGHTLLGALYALALLLIILNAGSQSTRWLRSRPLIWLGQVSYGIYLIHGIVLVAVFQAARRDRILDSSSSALLLVIALLTTLGVCAASYYWFERPFLRLGHRATYK